MKTKKLVELRKIKNGQLFRLPLNNSLYVRGDYCPRFLTFKCHRFDSCDVEVMLCADTPVFRASIAEYN